MLTISAFLVTAAAVLTSVWWACRNEVAPERDGLSMPSPDEAQSPGVE